MNTAQATTKQNVRFQGKMCLENFQLDQIQNGRLSAINYLLYYA